jgi:hypothetical protein
VQKIQYDKGGYLNWTNADWVDGSRRRSRARRAPPGCGNYRFLDAWLA